MTGQLRHQSTLSGVVNPSFLAIEPQGKTLYAVNELTREEEGSGTISAFAIDPDTGDLTFLNKQSSHGLAPAYVSIDPAGQFAFVANYATGTVAVLPVQPNGELRPASDVQQHHGSGPDPRQDGPHAHSILPDPSWPLCAVGRPGHGSDPDLWRLMHPRADCFRMTPPPMPLRPDPDRAILLFIRAVKFSTRSPSVPHRSMCLTTMPSKGALAPRQTLSTVPEGYDGFSAGADIHLSSDGRFLYASIRGQNTIAVYAVDDATGELTFVASESTQGETPRNFAIDPTGRYLLAANQDSDSVVVFRIDQGNGTLTPTGESYSIPSPVCLRFAPT